jgi:hypothetical protein
MSNSIPQKEKHMTNRELFDASRDKWGLNAQLAMFVEEANEASIEALHLIRGREESEIQFAKELADLQFMIDEMVYYFKNDVFLTKSFFDIMIEERRLKEKRLEQRLKGLK